MTVGSKAIRFTELFGLVIVVGQTLCSFVGHPGDTNKLASLLSTCDGDANRRTAATQYVGVFCHVEFETEP